jgi:RloB-like protein
MRRPPLSDQRQLSRRRPSRAPRARFLIFCEGEVTEPGYFQYIKQTLRDSMLTIEVSKDRGDPLRLVEAAVTRLRQANQNVRRYNDENLRWDQVWCVLDVDQHQRIDDARAMADKTGVRLAVSDPCFELWPLLHFVSHNAWISTEQVQEKLKKYIPDYQKRLDCELLRGHYGEARARALSLRDGHVRNDMPALSNPGTDVCLLVHELLMAANRSGSARKAI